MNTFVCGDINQVLHETCKAIMSNGVDVCVRGQNTKELHPALIELSNPRKRIMLYPRRGENPFASLYEALWVICSPDNGIATLRKFIPRADDFSDNPGTEKSVWRAGYPERIKKFAGIDQLEYVINKLKEDRLTRQAVMVLWNPVADTIPGSRDYPCSNHVVFCVRNGRLDCTVTMRSNDIIFGMSSINIYEFTIMQEIIAHEIGVPVGKYFHFVNSLHVYEKLYNKEPYDKVISMVEHDYGRFLRNMNADRVTAYGIPCFKFALSRRQLNCVYEDFERIIRADYNMVDVFNTVMYYEKPQMQDILVLLCIYDLCHLKNNDHWYHDMLNTVRWTDLKTACDFWYLKNVGAEGDTIKPDEIDVAIGHTIANSMIDKEAVEKYQEETSDELPTMLKEDGTACEIEGDSHLK